MLSTYKDKPLFSGKLTIGGEEVDVVDGQGTFDGKQYFVSKDGNFVMDMGMNVVAKIVDGDVRPLDKSDGPRLVSMGIIADPSKPQASGRSAMPSTPAPTNTGMLGLRS